MRYPQIADIPKNKENIDVFLGYNHNVRIGASEFYDMTNLTSDNYPTLSPRGEREVYATPLTPSGMISRETLYYIDSYIDKNTQGVYYKDSSGKEQKLTSIPYEVATSSEFKDVISMGAYIIIMPDKYFINTTDVTDRGYIEEEFSCKERNVRIVPCDKSGKEYSIAGEGPKPPSIAQEMLKPEYGAIHWIDTSLENWVIKQYDPTTMQWYSIVSYVKILVYDEEIGAKFSVKDSVSISFYSSDGEQELKQNMQLRENSIIFSKGQESTASYIVVDGVAKKFSKTSVNITIKRKMPDMDFIIESGNRLWGCKYGKNSDGIFVNEIYASKLGDFKNWYSFEGISTDSYAAAIGTSGAFTGAIAYLGYPLFLKENCIYKVYGNYPANFQIQEISCNGVEKGSDKSLAIVNNALYYKSKVGISMYDGSLPVVVSSALGDTSYINAVGGSWCSKYYVSMMDTKTKLYNLFVYDTKKGLWHREDDLQVVEFCECNNVLYYIPSRGKDRVKIFMMTNKHRLGNPVQWEAITGEIGANAYDKKYISRLDVRMRLALGSRVSFYAEYDSSGVWEHLYSVQGTKLDAFTMPIKPKRCDHLLIKVVGVGYAQIYSICKTIEYGGV